jgi:hypothetical protein
MNSHACGERREPLRRNGTSAPLDLLLGRYGVQHLLLEIHQPHD